MERIHPMQDERRSKPFLTYQEQIERLRQRNCRIKDDKCCENILVCQRTLKESCGELSVF